MLADPNVFVPEFVVRNVFVTLDQVAALVESDAETAERGLAGLVESGKVARRRLTPTQSVFIVTPEGLSARRSKLPPPVIDPSTFRRDEVLGWLWVRAMHGFFGTRVDVTTRREMQASGGRADADLRVAANRRFILVNVLLQPPNWLEWETKLRRLVSDPALWFVWFFVEDRPRFGTPMLELATRIGLQDATRVQVLPKSWATVS